MLRNHARGTNGKVDGLNLAISFDIEALGYRSDFPTGEGNSKQKGANSGVEVFQCFGYSIEPNGGCVKSDRSFDIN